jgi:hypothetical protein
VTPSSTPAPGRARALAAVLAVTGVLAIAGCAEGNSTDPRSAKSCDQLVERAVPVVRQLVEDLRGKTSADLELTGADDPYAVLTRPFEPFQARAEELGCDAGELRRLACSAYRGIEPTGPLAQEFLARVGELCR